jgi:membrane protein YqaA with SNARE-associated domain
MRIVRRLYDWVLRQAETPYAEWVLFFIAVAEASFFPLPPDVLLLPMAIAKRERAYHFAFLCTAGSVLGGLIGYGIGAVAMATIGKWIVHTYHMEAAMQRFDDGFAEWGVWIILAKGLTPIPFKLVTIASGAANLNLISFVLACAVSRGLRFCILAELVRRFGKSIQAFIERYLTWVFLALLTVILLGFWLVLR